MRLCAARAAIVVGVGNGLRSDDGAGPKVIEKLRDLLASSPGAAAKVRLRAEHQLLPELAADLGDLDLFVVVDAAVGRPPGHVRTTRIDPGAEPWTLGHHVQPGMILSYCRGLYGRAPAGFAVGIGARSFELGEGLSGEVDQAVERVAQGLFVLFTGQSTLHRRRQR